MKKIFLVTGGAGFIGSHVCEILLNLNYEVLLLDIFRQSKNIKRKQSNIKKIKHNSNLTLLDCDINNRKHLIQIFRKYRISYIVHLASKASVSHSITHPAHTVKDNLTGTTLLFEYAIQSEVKHIVFASSGLVYGLTRRLPMKENDPCFYPTSPYAVTIRATELLAYTFFHLYHIPFTGLRFFPIIGPRMRENLFLPTLVRQISQDLPVTIYGNGLTVRGYAYIDDVIEGIVGSITKPEGFQLINLGGEKPISLIDLIKIVEKVLGKKAKIIFKPQRKEEIIQLYPDIGKANKFLRWTPKVSIEEGIKRYISWYNSDDNFEKIS